MVQWLLILCLAPVLLLLGCQAKLIYYPRPYDESHRQMLAQHHGVALPYETPLGRQVAHYIPPRDGRAQPDAVWLCFGGNGTVGLDWLNYIEDWPASYAYLLVDYPGYGDCKGNPSPDRIRASSQAAFAALSAHLSTGPDRQPKLGVLAHSIGCAAGLMAANDLDISRLILIAPFTSLTDMGRLILGWPLCHVNMHRFDNRRELAAAVERHADVIIIHGTEDEVVPVSMSRELAARHPSQVTFHEAEGWDHNRILFGFREQIAAAMQEVMKNPARP